jgi:hypothetical protein
MTYRDEQEALRAENQSLRAELEQLKQSPAGAPPLAARTGAGARIAVVVAIGAMTVVLAVLVVLISSSGPRTRTPPRAAHWVGAQWEAQVTTAAGIDLPVGARCSIQAAVDASRASSEMPREVRVVCADRELYWLGAARAAGGSMMTSGQCRRMQLRSDDHAAFSCEFEERGTELRAYPRVAIDTANRTAIVAREGAAPMRVVLAVDALSQFAPIR